MAALWVFWASTCRAISRALLTLIPLTSARRSGSSSRIVSVFSPNFRMILAARAFPIPLIAPDPRYLSIASSPSGSLTSYCSTLNWSPYDAWEVLCPKASMDSPSFTD